MTDWPAAPIAGQGTFVIGPGHPWALGAAYRAMNIAALSGNTAWPAANRAIMFPFRVPHILTAYQGVAGCGTTGGGNFDIGIYDQNGNLLVSSGATARSASAEVVANFTDTALLRGVYYAAMSVDGTSNMMATSAAIAGLLKMAGMRQATSAYVLPATITMETVAATVIPNFAIWLRSQ